MPDNRSWLNVRVRLFAGVNQRAERTVLGVCVNMGISALKFNPNTKIVALFTPAPIR